MESLIALGIGAIVGAAVPAKVWISSLVRQRDAVDDAVRLLVPSKHF